MEGGRCVSAECRFYSPWKLEDDREVGIGPQFLLFLVSLLSASVPVRVTDYQPQRTRLSLPPILLWSTGVTDLCHLA